MCVCVCVIYIFLGIVLTSRAWNYSQIRNIWQLNHILVEMNTVYKSYRFELMPDKEQKIFFNDHLGCCRFVYNHFLNQRIEQYKKDKKSDNYHAQSLALTQLKKQDDTAWLNDINSQSLQASLRFLDTAFVNFFEGRAGFPRFKSRKHSNSFTIPQYGKLQGNEIKIPKFKKGIKVKVHREVMAKEKEQPEEKKKAKDKQEEDKKELKIGKMTITRTPRGKYFVSILVEEEIKPFPKSNKAVGIDLGISSFAVTSDNQTFPNHRYLKKLEQKLKQAQKHLTRKKKGSNGYEKQRLKVAKLHEKIANARLDTLHKVSYSLVKENGILVVEDLNVKGMMKNKKLAKHIADVSWGTFVRLLAYKCNWYGRELVRIDRFYPSSKTCSQCGWINKELDLSMRKWTCANGHKFDRDYNARANILPEGVR